MSISVLKHIFESQDATSSGNFPISIEFLNKSTLYSLVLKTISNYHKSNKKLIILNFDPNFYNSFKNENKLSQNLTEKDNILALENTIIINLLNNESLFNSNKNFFDFLNLNSIEAKNLLIIGLDLISKEKIEKFFCHNEDIIYKFLFVVYLFSFDKTSKNLVNYVENRKELIRRKVTLSISEKTYYIHEQSKKIHRLFEIHNLIKLTKELQVFSFDILNGNHISKSIFDKISLYLNEFKTMFETNNTKIDEKKEEPLSTFKLTLNENEVKARNNIVLPYLINNDKKELKVEIDPEDLNELYEEDPDADLDI